MEIQQLPSPPQDDDFIFFSAVEKSRPQQNRLRKYAKSYPSTLPEEEDDSNRCQQGLQKIQHGPRVHLARMQDQDRPGTPNVLD